MFYIAEETLEIPGGNTTLMSVNTRGVLIDIGLKWGHVNSREVSGIAIVITIVCYYHTML